jgi:hypothetical protein
VFPRSRKDFSKLRSGEGGSVEILRLSLPDSLRMTVCSWMEWGVSDKERGTLKEKGKDIESGENEQEKS